MATLSVGLLKFFVLTLPSPGRVDEEIDKMLPLAYNDTIPPLVIEGLSFMIGLLGRQGSIVHN